MLSKYRDVTRLTRKSSVNSFLIKNASYREPIHKFLQRGAPHFDIFSSVVFSGKINSKSRNKKGSGGSGACFPANF